MTSQPVRAVRLHPQPLTAEGQALRESVSACMQCGTCSGSCPSAPKMDYMPRQIMAMLQMGLEDEAVRSQAIWTCAACYMCTVRCPRGIPVSEVMGELRTLALQRGVAGRKDRLYVRSFLEIVRRYGRMFEVELLMRYHVPQNPLALIKQLPLAVQMLKLGKIEFLPQRLRRQEEVRRLYKQPKRDQEPAQGGG